MNAWSVGLKFMKLWELQNRQSSIGDLSIGRNSLGRNTERELPKSMLKSNIED
jgi:hypothetical protein